MRGTERNRGVAGIGTASLARLRPLPECGICRGGRHAKTNATSYVSRVAVDRGIPDPSSSPRDDRALLNRLLLLIPERARGVIRGTPFMPLARAAASLASPRD